MFSLPRDVSGALLNLLPIPTDQSLSNADPSLRRPSLRSELKKKGVSSLRLRRPRSRVSLILNCMTADPSRSTLTSTRMTRSASLRFLVQCSINSMPREMRKKTVNFVCLPEGRVAKLYAERIERGEILQELKHQPVAFKAEMDQPVSCKPRQV